jgi:hypothetical protein
MRSPRAADSGDELARRFAAGRAPWTTRTGSRDSSSKPTDEADPWLVVTGGGTRSPSRVAELARPSGTGTAPGRARGGQAPPPVGVSSRLWSYRARGWFPQGSAAEPGEQLGAARRCQRPRVLVDEARLDQNRGRWPAAPRARPGAAAARRRTSPSRSPGASSGTGRAGISVATLGEAETFADSRLRGGFRCVSALIGTGAPGRGRSRAGSS